MGHATRWLAISAIILAISGAVLCPLLLRRSVPDADHAAKMEPEATQRITSVGSFETLIASSPSPVLIDFNSPACAPCAVLSPILEGYARRHRGAISVLSVDVTQLQDLATRFQVDDLPLVVRLDHGRETARFVGVKNETELAAWLAANAPAR